MPLGMDSNNSSVPDNGTDGRYYPFLKQGPVMITILIVAYVVVFFLSIVNNILVILAILRTPQLKNTTNLFVGNLAIADVLVTLLVFPLNLLDNIFKDWLYGAVLCKMFNYMQGLVIGASTNTLTAIAIERYMAIFHPNSTNISKLTTICLLTVIWTIPALIFIPFILKFEQRTYIYSRTIQCVTEFDENLRKIYILGVIFVACYLLPMIIIAVFYTLIICKVWKRRVAGIKGSRAEKNINRSKIRIVRMLVTVCVAFALSWLPFYTLQLLIIFHKFKNYDLQVIQKYIKPLFQWLGAANSCMNPFIYCYFSSHFRRSIQAILKSRSLTSRIFLTSTTQTNVRTETAF